MSEIEQLKSQLLLNTRLNFQSEFDYDTPIKVGKIVSISEAETELKSEPDAFESSMPLENEVQYPFATVLADQSIVASPSPVLNTFVTSVIEQNETNQPSSK